MDFKSVHKSNTFSSFSHETHKFGNWFASLNDLRKIKLMKVSKSLGKLLLCHSLI